MCVHDQVMLFTTCVLAWHTYAYTLEQEDGPDALEEVTNNNLLPGGKKLRSDDPNYKSSEQIRCGAREAPWRVAVFGVGGLVGGLEQGKQ